MDKRRLPGEIHDDDIVDWDVRIEDPPKRKSQTVQMTFGETRSDLVAMFLPAAFLVGVAAGVLLATLFDLHYWFYELFGFVDGVA